MERQTEVKDVDDRCSSSMARLDPAAWNSTAFTFGNMSERLAKLMDTQRGAFGQFYDELKLAADGFDVAAERRQIHVGLVFDLGHRWLLDVERERDIGLSLASNLPKFAEALDLSAERFVAAFDSHPPLSRQRGDNIC
jgi:hypothetical protein